MELEGDSEATTDEMHDQVKPKEAVEEPKSHYKRSHPGLLHNWEAQSKRWVTVAINDTLNQGPPAFPLHFAKTASF